MRVDLQSCYLRILFWSVVSTLFVSLLFVFFPSLDIEFSSIFWNADNGFYLADNPLVVFSAVYNYWLVVIYLLVIIVSSLVYWRWRIGHDFRHSMFMLASFLLGPGLIVNGILKSLWGRARPLNTDIFGGSDTFSPAWYISDQCATNCSFVSGHASAAFAFYAFTFLIFSRFRIWLLAFILVAIFGLAVGLGRVVEGKHFLSDTIIAGHLLWLTAMLCYYPVWRTNR